MGLSLPIKQKWAGNAKYFPFYLQLFLFFLSLRSSSLDGVAFRHSYLVCGNLSLGGVMASEWPQERKKYEK